MSSEIHSTTGPPSANKLDEDVHEEEVNLVDKGNTKTKGEDQEAASLCLNQNAEDSTYEEVIEKLGHAGKSQIVQCALGLCPMLCATFMSLGFVFLVPFPCSVLLEELWKMYLGLFIWELILASHLLPSNLGYSPPHACNTVNETALLASQGFDHDVNNSTTKISYGKCAITISRNQSGHWKDTTSLRCPKGHNFTGGQHTTLVSEWDLVCDGAGQAEFMMLLNTLGKIVGGLSLPSLADHFGRKPVLCIACMMMALTQLAMAFSPSFSFICVVAFLGGVSFSGVGSTYLVLGMEMLSARHRHVFGIVVCQYWVFCVLTIGVIAYLLEDSGWRYFQGTGAALGLLGLLLPFFLHESPRWLAINGRPVEALAILEKASVQNGSDFGEVKKTFNKYMDHVSLNKQRRQQLQMRDKQQQQQHRQMQENGVCDHTGGHFVKIQGAKNVRENQLVKFSILKMLAEKRTRVLLLAMWYIWTTCNVTYFGIYMFSSNLTGNRFLNFCIMAMVEIPSNFLVLYSVNKLGRLQVLRIFLSLATASLLSSLLLDCLGGDSPNSEMAGLVLFIFGKFAITCTFNAVYIFTPEMFPTVLRSTGFGSCKSIAKVGAMLAPYLRPLYFVAKWAPGVIFSSLCFLAFLLTFVLPEMKDKVLPTDITDVERTKKTFFKRERKRSEDLSSAS